MKPTQRHTKSRKRIRRSAIKLTKETVAVCPKCKKPIAPHTACSFCGTYKGQEAKKIKKTKKALKPGKKVAAPKKEAKKAEKKSTKKEDKKIVKKVEKKRI